MALSMLPPEPERQFADDYVIDREGQRVHPPISSQVVRGVRLLLVVLLCLVSFALFWVVGTMIGLF